MSSKSTLKRPFLGLAGTLKRLHAAAGDDAHKRTADDADAVPPPVSASDDRAAAVDVVLLVGITCAGKTAFARRHFATHAVVARKHLRARVSKRRAVSRDDKLLAVVTTHLRHGRAVLLDASHARRATRARAVQTVRAAASAAGVCVRLTAYVFDVDMRRFVARNQRRAAFDAAARTAPDALIAAEARAFEWPSTFEAGFDQMFSVSSADHGDDDDDDSSDSGHFHFRVTPYVGRLGQAPL
jgi:predicted kinase